MRFSTTILADSGKSPITAGHFALRIPAFSPAISATVGPSICQWSRLIEVMTLARGVSQTFVASNLPPNPVSMTAMSVFC